MSTSQSSSSEALPALARPKARRAQSEIYATSDTSSINSEIKKSSLLKGFVDRLFKKDKLIESNKSNSLKLIPKQDLRQPAPPRRTKSTKSKTGDAESPLYQDFKEPLSFVPPTVEVIGSQKSLRELKPLPQSLEVNVSGVQVQVTTATPNRDPPTVTLTWQREQGNRTEGHGKLRKLSTIQSVETNDDSDTKSSNSIEHSNSMHSFISEEEEEEHPPAPVQNQEKKRPFGLSNPSSNPATEEMLAKSLRKLDQDLEDIALGKNKSFSKPELITTSSSSRLEVPVMEPKRRKSNDSTDSNPRRSSNASSHSTSSSKRNSGVEEQPTPLEKSQSPLYHNAVREEGEDAVRMEIQVVQPENGHSEDVPVLYVEPSTSGALKK